MNWVIQKTLRKLRKIHAALYPASHETFLPKLDYEGQKASDQIRNLLEKNQPCMVCRFGLTELRVVVNYIDVANAGSFLSKCHDYITEKRDSFWWTSFNRTNIYNLSGFYPTTDEMLAKFGILMLNDTKQIDLLASWRKLENRVNEYLPPGLIRIPLPGLVPFRHKNPWSEALAGKKVLVIHPFEESIKQQYAKRKLLFQDPRVLPDFELKTLKAVQSLLENKHEFSDWFAAFDWMTGQIDQTDFDIAIIGAGAYGLPLAAHVKRMGKKAVHIGGATQLLFGIRGKRWDDSPDLKHLYNEHWTRPQAQEAPKNFQLVEQGCYW
jgi:hypothetical protein